MKFTFLLSSDSHVRFIKRVEIINKLVSDVTVFAFKRKGSYPGKHINFTLQNLGAITHESYIKRLIHISKSLNKIRRSVKNTNVIYTFGLDMLFLGWISKLLSLNKKVQLVYEVGDIREVLIGNSIINKVFRIFERFLITHVALLVVTSEAFFQEYFLGIQRAKDLKYHVIENKLDLDLMPSINSNDFLRKDNKPFTIGYFGVLRCERTWKILKLLAKKGNGKIKIYIKGISVPTTKDNIEEIENIHGMVYGGPYVVPDDLPEIYGEVDMVWSCYPYQGNEVGNWNWARTIRFYESCFYKKPVFVQKETEDCKSVKKYNIGVCLDLENIETTVDYILALTHKDIVMWQKNMERLPENIYLYSNEHKELIKRLEI